VAEQHDRRAEVAAKHALGILAGYLALGMVAKGAGHMLSKPSRSAHTKKLNAYANASQPIYSPDMNLNDADIEKTIRSYGVPKEAATDVKGQSGTADSLADKFLNVMPSMKHPADISGFFSGMFDPKYHPMHPAMTVTAAAGGSMLGWKLASKLLNKRREKDLDSKIEQARNEMDRLIKEQYMMNRREKEAAWVAPTVSAGAKTYMLYALLASIAAGVGAKAYFDDKDPARKRLKAIKQYAAEKAVVENPPVILDMPKDQEQEIG